MKFIFYSPVAFEKWDWRNSVEKGIGGSETSHVEMSWRLAARGHEVVTYAPIPDDCPGEWRGTKWYPLEQADFSEEGIWILYRCPEIVDKFLPKKKTQQLWLMMQDWDYPTWNGEEGEVRVKNTDAVITLCKSHGFDVVQKHPLVESNLWLTSNGIKTDLIKEIEEDGVPERNPKRIMYASSPDRGLKYGLISFKKAREIIPDLEFHAFYGFNNLDKLIEGQPAHWLAKNKREIMELLEQPGVTFHGRVSQKELYKEWFKSGIWLYETNFNETSCITSMEAQACGAIPIVSPVYALKENVQHGVGIVGDANDPLTQARFAAEIVKMVMIPGLQDVIRSEMMPWARERFDWEVFVDHWIAKAEGKEWPKDKFPFQLSND